MAMRNEVSDIRENWGLIADLNTDQEVQDYLDEKYDGDYNDGVSHLKNLTLDPVFTMNDDRYFDVINRSTHANFHVDMSKLYDYYDVTYDEESNRPYIEDSEYDSNSGSDDVVCATDLCWDGSSRDPVDCSCPAEPNPEPEPEPTANLKVTPGDYSITGQNSSIKATANQIIITMDGADEQRFTIDTATNQYVNAASGVTQTLELHTFDNQNMSYTGVDWNGESITLTATDQVNSGNDGSEQNTESDSQSLINMGILAAIFIIVLSLMAIQSMRNQDE